MSSYYHFGILQSAVHEYWAWARGSTLEERLRYTNTTIFETFPFPPLLPSGAGGPARHSPVAPASAPEGGRTPPRSAAPPDGGTAIRNTGSKEEDADTAVRATGVNYDPRVVPQTPEALRVAEVAEELYAKRQAACRALGLGLTKLYNYIKGKTPLTALSAEHQALITELQTLHERLNSAVCACYGWPEEAWRDEDEVLRRLLELNRRLAG